LKQIKLLIGIALALVLCISPVGAVYGNDFDIYIDNFNDDGHDTYKYYNKYTPSEKYICLHAQHSKIYTSLVTFKPANLKGAPVMVVDTSFYDKDIYLTNTVDKWEIKVYYSFSKRLTEPDDKYLYNAGVLSMYDTFRPWYRYGGDLRFELSSEVSIRGYFFDWDGSIALFKYYIPKVN
jgi:hypothetical protein